MRPSSTAACSTSVRSYGKHLFARFGGDTLHVHLGLYGTFTGGAGQPAAAARGPPDALGGGRPRRHRRVDRPARTDRLRGADAAGGAARSSPGSDPTPSGRGPTAGGPSRASRASRTPIGALLMDQSVLAGVGNVFRAELLFRHGVSPFRTGRGVDGDAVGADVGRPGHR